MKVSTKGRYGLRALVDLTVYSTDNHVSLVSIAERQKISLNYLEQVFAILRKAGIVKSIKGAQGGYILSDKPENIKVSTILRVLEGDFNIIDENIYDDEHIDAIQAAVKNLVWLKINENVNRYLESTTLEDLANEYRRLNNIQPIMYYI
ncbi:RrF2 family transcriptional regulator [Anaeromicropila herbilytica]|uniref:Rrf2 family transcriptional regulator n=1 Tax=Anaeromicropila herbilytica TaxID=2785025 RepID=A0A7R7ENT0_9FIRM|nr:Rrf2 family transcriptional regulator [Anaeromicropila herbilytica]BCN32203.1 Rrf2 family transcriptional regulator [Anaeromicropila herbilytica]